MTNANDQSGNELREKVTAAYSSGRDKAEKALTSAKASTSRAADVAKSKARAAASSTSDSLEKNPLSALIGGIAIGAIAAALVPKTRQEAKILGAAGVKIRQTAIAAAKAARSAGKEQLDTLGLNGSAARDTIRDVIEKIGQAAVSASKAAGETVRKKP